MKIEVTEDYHYVLKEVFVPVIFKTESGEELSICMRDEGFEITMLNPLVKSEERHVNKYVAGGGFIHPLYPPASKASVHPCSGDCNDIP